MPDLRSGAGNYFLNQIYVIRFPGDDGGGATPVPIPNTAVKPSSADGTAVYCGRVGRRQEFKFLKIALPFWQGFFYVYFYGFNIEADRCGGTKKSGQGQ